MASLRSTGVARNTLWTMANFAVHVLFVNTVTIFTVARLWPMAPPKRDRECWMRPRCDAY